MLTVTCGWDHILFHLHKLNKEEETDDDSISDSDVSVEWCKPSEWHFPFLAQKRYLCIAVTIYSVSRLLTVQ